MKSTWQAIAVRPFASRQGEANAQRKSFKPRLEPLEDRCLPAVDVILEWNAIMINADRVAHSGGVNDQPGPILAARAFAIASAAMYDAYNSIEHMGERYLTQAPNSGNADSDAAVAKAAHDTLVALYPSQRVAFDAALTQTLARIPNGTREDRGVAVGAFVAARILGARANDGASTIQDPAYVPNGQPGFHNADPTNPSQGFYAPDAEDVTPFAIRNVDQFAPGHLGAQGVGSPTTDIAAFLRSDDYEDAYAEVKRLGGNGTTTLTERTDEQTQIGIYWGYDGSPGLGTPPRLYNQIARTVAIQENNSEAENARLFALLNIAMFDAGLTAWDAKYDEQLWRPILGVRGGASDGNDDTQGDAGWTPLGAPRSNPFPGETNFTPPFPAYTSGHATFGAAVFQTLERFYGTSNITFTFVSDEFNGVTRGANGQVRPIVARTFTSFDQAAEENGQSRIYLGIHWAFDKTEGIRTGNQVANYVFDNFLDPNSGSHGSGHTDVILEWNDIMINADRVAHSGGVNDQPGPILAGRAFAITSAAMYDAYNSIEHIGERYLTQAPNSTNADSDAAVARAAHDTLVALYPSQRVAFDAALTQTLARIPNGSRESRGVAVGAFVAARILEARANDGASTIQDPPYLPNGQPGFHNVDPTNAGQGFYAPDAQNVTPFAVQSVSQFAPGHLGAQGVGSPTTDIAAFLRTDDYAKAYAEVKRLGGNGTTTVTERTNEQTQIGIYWGYDGSPGLGTPPRLYNQIARTIAIQESNSEAENARLFTLLNIAMADAGLTAWNAKYDELFWRPILGIRGGASDGNPDTLGDSNWTPLGAPRSNPFPGETNFTPPFPAYTSGHATFGAAVFQTLERFFGSNVTFTFVSDEFDGVTRNADGQVRPIVARTFTSLDQAAEENGQSRIYLGIHWAFDKTEGIRTGNQVANYVFNNFLRPGH